MSESKLPALPKAFTADLDAYAPQIKLVLPDHIPIDKFRRVVQTAVQLNPNLIAQGANIPTLWNACIRLAEMGLYPDGREAALVRFGADITPMPMVAGLLKLARNSGQLKAISAHVVYTNDDFHYRLGDAEEIVHEPALDEERGELRCAYAIARLAGAPGEPDIIQREVMSKADIEKVRAVSRAKDAPKGPWVQWPEEMWRKSALRRLIKYLPRSTDRDDMRLQRALEADNEGYVLEGTATETVAATPKVRRLQAVKEAAKAKARPEPTPVEEFTEEVETVEAEVQQPTQEAVQEREPPPPPKPAPKPAPAPAPAAAPAAAKEEVETVDVISEDGEPLTIARHKKEKIVNALNSALREAASLGPDALDRVWEANQHLKDAMTAGDWKLQERAQQFRVEQLAKQAGLAPEEDEDEPPPPLGDE